MSALHEAARLVVAAWTSTRRTWVEQCNAAVLALDAALKAEPVQEPVAWSYELATTMLEHGYDGWEHRITRYKPNVPEGSIRNLTPLYAAPPQRPPLTDEEISDIYIDWDITPGRRIADLVRAIERKVRGEKE